MKRHLVLLSLVLMSLSLLTACKNTVSGFGEDMEHNGAALKKSMNNDQ